MKLKAGVLRNKSIFLLFSVVIKIYMLNGSFTVGGIVSLQKLLVC